MSCEEEAVDSVAFGAVDYEWCVVGVVSVPLGGCPPVGFVDGLDLFGRGAAFGKVPYFEGEPKVGCDTYEGGVFRQDCVTADEVLSGSNLWLHIRRDFDGAMQRAFGDGPDLDGLGIMFGGYKHICW